ncbi:MAG: ribosome biogenesis GTP-binding protein YihA/YsxC [Myxococcota bacterium]
MNVELAHDAAGPEQFPGDGLPEVAILGRSNVGKSTFINALVGRRRLARTSRRPGKTRRIHFYRLERAAYIVDLPGFGYAAVGRRERRAWRALVEAYLRGTRETLRGALLLVDARRGLEAEELDLLEWLDGEKIAARVVLIKADKLRRGEIARALAALAEQVHLPPESLAAASGKTGRGLARVGSWLRGWIDLELRRADGTPLLD